MKLKKKKPYINYNAGNVEANTAAFNHAATGGNMMGEELNDSDIHDLIEFIQYNGARYRGGEIPKADPFMINQINIPDNMRLKWYDVDIIDNNTLQLSYVTQEPFDSKDSEVFIEEVKRFFKALLEKEDYDKPLNVALDVECRDGEEYGKLVYDLKFNEENNMKLENLTEDAKVNLDNVTDIEEKSKEVVDPGFADGVREIIENQPKVAELEKVRKAPEQGEEVLPDDLKITLDESLFESTLNETGEWEDDEEGLLMKQELSDKIRDLTGQNVSIDHIKGFDKYQGPYYSDGEFEYWLGETPDSLFLKDNRSNWYLINHIDDFRNLKNGALKPYNESIKNKKGIKRIKELKEEIDYSIDDYLTDIKYSGDGYITIEKIDFDIDQGDYKFTTAEVLNKAIKDGWSFKDDENEGLCLISNHNKIWKDVKDAVKNESLFGIDFDFKPDMTLRDAYEKYQPEEFQLDKIRNDMTLAELWKAIQDGKDVYEVASVDGQGFDSDVREGLFDMISQAFGIDYDIVYNTWLKD